MSSSFVEFREPSIHDPRYPSSFVRTVDGFDANLRPTDGPSTSHTYGYPSHHSRHSSRQTSNQSYSYTRPAPPPIEAIQGIPTPALAARGLAELEDPDAEYMEVDPVTDLEGGMQEDYQDADGSAAHPPRRRFVGGFVAGLRKLPRAVARNLLHDKRAPRPTKDYQPGYETTEFTSPYHQQPLSPDFVPAYDAPGEPVEGDIHYVEAVDMPTEHLTVPPQIRTSSHSIHSGRAPSRLTVQSTSHVSAPLSQHGSIHPSRASASWTVRNPDPETPTEGSATAHDHPPGQVPVDGTTAPVGPPNISSPVYVEPRPASDYDRMASPVRPPSERSIPSQFARVGKFFRDLNNLPWVSSNIAVDFVPADSARSRYLRSKQDGSWYSARHRNVDLLAGGPSTQALAAASGLSLGQAPIQGSSATLPYQNGQRHGSQSSSEGAYPQQHSSQGHGPYMYPVAPLLPPPQPMYMYPAAYPPAGSPRVSPGQASSSATNSNPEMQQMQPAYPVYMIAMPAAPYMQVPDPARHPPHHHHPAAYPAHV